MNKETNICIIIQGEEDIPRLGPATRREGAEMLLLQAPGPLWEAETPHQRPERGRRWSP